MRGIFVHPPRSRDFCFVSRVERDGRDREQRQRPKDDLLAAPKSGGDVPKARRRRVLVQKRRRRRRRGARRPARATSAPTTDANGRRHDARDDDTDNTRETTHGEQKTRFFSQTLSTKMRNDRCSNLRISGGAREGERAKEREEYKSVTNVPAGPPKDPFPICTCLGFYILFFSFFFLSFSPSRFLLSDVLKTIICRAIT